MGGYHAHVYYGVTWVGCGADVLESQGVKGRRAILDWSLVQWRAVPLSSDGYLCLRILIAAEFDILINSPSTVLCNVIATILASFASSSLLSRTLDQLPIN